MRSVPQTLLKIGLAGTVLVAIAGCGGTASVPTNTGTATATASEPVPGVSSTSPTPSNSTSSPPGSPPNSSSGGSSPSPTPSPNPTPSSPAGTTISNIEQMSGWDSCDTCSGGGTIGYSMTQGLNYPQSSTTQFSLAQGVPWAHALWWKRLGNDPSPTHFVLTLDQYMDNPGASFGIEYEANQLVNGQWYDFAIQCSFGYGIWQLWDPANQLWVPTSVPCQRPAPSTHTQLRLEFQRSNGQAVFVSIGTNGNIVPVNMAFNPQPMAGLSGDFGVHIQLNANGNPDPYSVWIHDLSLNYW